MTLRRVHVPALAAGTLTLPAEAAHYLIRVLRLSPGDRVRCFDGQGHEATGELLDLQGTLRFEGPPEPALRLPARALLLGLLKGPAMDDAVRMATEAGATAIRPVLCRRSVADGDRRDRWLRIVTEAARQCGRADVPALEAPATLTAALAAVQALPVRRVAAPGAPVLGGTDDDAAILVGPEGGLTPFELDEALAAGFVPAGLGPWVLRAATAAPVAVASLHRG